MRLLAVNHHYYRESAPESGIYPITPAAFDDEIALLAKSWQIASQDATIEALSLPQSSVALCLITFDDGLKEQMAAARTRMSSAGCSADTRENRWHQWFSR